MSTIVSTNIIAFPKLIQPTNLLANGLQYYYKLVQNLEQSNLYIEIISQVQEEAEDAVEGTEVVPTIQTTYLSPDDFGDEMIRAAISKEILEFLLELNLIEENEFESAQQKLDEDGLSDSDEPASAEVIAANEAASAAEDATTTSVDATPVV
jgi:hypothetical protein